MSLLKLKLKPPAIKHLAQVVELDNLCLGGLWTIEGYKRELESPNSTFLVLVLETNHKSEKEHKSNGKFIDFLKIKLKISLLKTAKNCSVVGVFWSILEEAHITLLAIHPDFQGQGLGQLLLYALIKDALERKLERATLEVRASNQVALSLYQKFGFKIAGRRKGYYQNTGEDALILWQGDLSKPKFLDDLAVWKQQISDRLKVNHWLLEMANWEAEDFNRVEIA